MGRREIQPAGTLLEFLCGEASADLADKRDANPRDQFTRDGRLAAGKAGDSLTSSIDDLDRIVLGADGRGAIEDDGVAVLLLELAQRIDVGEFLRFQSEPHNPAATLLATQFRQDIRGFDEFQFQRDSSLGKLAGKTRGRPIVAHRRRRDYAVTIVPDGIAGREELIGRFHSNNVRSRGGRESDRAADQVDFVAGSQRRFRQRVPHPSTARVGEIPDVIKILAGRAGGDEDVHEESSEGVFRRQCRRRCASD